jgi:hypothetical protein
LGRFEVPSAKSRVDRRVDAVVLKSLEKDPGRRYQSAAEFETGIHNSQSVPPVATMSPPKPIPKPAPPTKTTFGPRTETSRDTDYPQGLLTLYRNKGKPPLLVLACAAVLILGSFFSWGSFLGQARIQQNQMNHAISDAVRQHLGSSFRMQTMQTTMTTDSNRKKNLRTYGWMSLSFAVTLLTLGGWLLFMAKPVVVSEPIFFSRNGDDWSPQGEIPVSQFAWSERTGELTTNNQLGSVASYTSGVADYGQLKHIVVLNQSDELMAHQVGPILASGLRQIPSLQQIDFYPYGKSPQFGNLAPDYYVTLRVSDVVQETGVGSKTTKAKISCLVSRTLCRSNYSDTNKDSVPSFHYNGEFNMEFSGTNAGLTTSVAKLKIESQNIGKTLAESIGKALTQVHDTNGLSIQPPEQLFPEFEKADLPAAFVGMRNEMIVASRSLMANNESIWQILDDNPFDNLAAHLKQTLPSENWEVIHVSSNQLHARRGKEYLFVGQHHQANTIPRSLTVTHLHTPIPVKASTQSQVSTLAPAAESAAIYVHYTNRLDEQRVKEIVEAYLAIDQPIDAVLPLLCQRFPDRLEELLKTKKCSSARSWYAIANTSTGSKKTELAKMAVRNANIAVEMECGDTTDLRQKINTLADKLDVKIDIRSQSTDDFVAAGAKQVPLDLAAPMTLQLGLQQNTLLTVATQPPFLIAVRVIALDDGEFGAELKYRHGGTISVENARRISLVPLRIPLGHDDKVLVMTVTPSPLAKNMFAMDIELMDRDEVNWNRLENGGK